jgi:hypothetical protein
MTGEQFPSVVPVTMARLLESRLPAAGRDDGPGVSRPNGLRKDACPVREWGGDGKLCRA